MQERRVRERERARLGFHRSKNRTRTRERESFITTNWTSSECESELYLRCESLSGSLFIKIEIWTAYSVHNKLYMCASGIGNRVPAEEHAAVNQSIVKILVKWINDLPRTISNINVLTNRDDRVWSKNS